MADPIKKIEGLPYDPNSSGSIQAGCGDNDAIPVRLSTDGVIANVEATISKENGNGQLIGGIIDVSSCSLIGLFLNINPGSLTDASVRVQFSDGIKKGNFHYLTAGSLSAGVVTVTKLTFTFTALTGNIVIPIQNPGSKQMRIVMSSTGVTTGSSAVISVARGWGYPKMNGV